MTTTFMIEAMASANAQLRWKRREQEEVSWLRRSSMALNWGGGGGLPLPQEPRQLSVLMAQSRETNLPVPVVLCGLFSRSNPDVWLGEEDEPQ